MNDRPKPPENTLPLSGAHRVDLVCDRFEAAWRQRPCIEQFLDDRPEPERSALLRELIQLEIELRRAQGESPKAAEYVERFGVEVTEINQSTTAQAGPTRYRVLDEIGKGGMGEVLRAHDPELRRELAVKVLRPELVGHPEAVRRFVEEARIGGRLQHPGVVPVYDLGWFADGRPFFIMKLIRGQTLAHLLYERPDPTKDLPRFLMIFEQICQTMAYAHSEGVIHRDLKPGNVMVGAFGEIQVVDWGLAKILRRAGEATSSVSNEQTFPPLVGDQSLAETRPDSVLGTLAFMPPEQARGEVAKLDERCDVYALGAILCNILTGHPPYHSYQDSKELHRKVKEGNLQQAWTELDQCGAEAELVKLAKHCLAADLEARPRNAGEVANAVTGYLAQVQERLRAAEMARERALVLAKEERKRRKLALGLAGSILATLLLAGSAWLWLERTSQQRWFLAEKEATSYLANGQRLHADANHAASIDIQTWAKARAEARRAEGRLEGEPGHNELRQEITNLLAELEEEEKDRELAARLEETASEGLEIPTQGFDPNRFPLLYASMFRDNGLEIQGLSAQEAAERIRTRKIFKTLVAALDVWAFIVPRSQNELTNHLLEVARIADPDPWRVQVRVALKKGDRAALVQIASELDVSTRTPPDLRLLGRGLAALKAFPEAVNLLQDAQKQYPADYWINSQLAQAFILVSPPRYDEAILFNTVAMALRDQSLSTRLRLGTNLLGRNKPGDMEAAMATYKQILRGNPDYFPAHLSLAGAHLIRNGPGDLDAAVTGCRKAVHLNGDSATARTILSHALRERNGPGDVNEAIAASRKAIQIQNNDSDAFSNLGAALAVRNGPGDLNEAIEFCTKAIQMSPKNADAQHNLGTVLLQKNDRLALNHAITHFQKALAINPELTEAHNNLGQAYWKRNQGADLDSAIACYRTAIRSKPNFLVAHDNLAFALAQRNRPGDMDEAIREWQFVTSENNAMWNARYNLGLALLGRNGPGDRVAGIAALRAAIPLLPQEALIHCNIGQILRDVGSFTEAVAELRIGDRLGKRDPNWKQPSSQWIREVQRLEELDRKLPAVLDGKEEISNVGELIEYAWLCQHYKKQYLASANLYLYAFSIDPAPAGLPKIGQHYNPACAAAQAAAGHGEGAEKSPGEQSRWRRQALTWLQADLADWGEELKKSPAMIESKFKETLSAWQRDGDFASLRDEAALARLTPEERQLWRQFWKRVADLHAGASGK